MQGRSAGTRPVARDRGVRQAVGAAAGADEGAAAPIAVVLASKADRPDAEPGSVAHPEP
jgi:hypothetical protein